MKKIILSTTLLLLIATAFSQTTDNYKPTKDYYLKKSKSQKAIAWIMLGAGVAMGTAGQLQINKNIDDDSFGALANIGPTILFAAGCGIAIGSIPFFISSAKNKKRAASISFSTKKNLLMQQNSFAYKIQPAITLKVHL